MVRRTSDGTGEAAYQRLARRTEEAQHEANRRVEGMFDTMLDEVRGLRTEIRGVDQRGEQRSQATEQRLSELELQINMTRDEVQRRALNPAPSQIASAKKAIEDKLKTWQARVTLWTGGVALAGILASMIPDSARFIDRLLDFLQGKEVSAVDVVIPKDYPAKVPEK